MNGILNTRMPSEAAQLAFTFDAERLKGELAALRQHQWSLQRPYGNDIGTVTEADWRCLSMRSPGGDPARTDPGGPGTLEFADTPWLERAPYVREVLSNIPAPLRSVRFMALGPGAKGVEHSDTKYGPQWGVARLHIPLTTNPGAILVLDGKRHWWQPGEFWFGDFSRMHWVENSGEEVRIHLVIDVLFVPELAAIFPEQWRDYFARGDALYARSEQPLASDQLKSFSGRFRVPASFLDWEEEDGQFLQPQPQVDVRTYVEDGELYLEDQGQTCFRLIHLGGNEFRFAGWSEERSLAWSEDRQSIHLRTHYGVKRLERDVVFSPQTQAVNLEPSAK
ncbi:aspartyl/asparaginyl beta-hydroxylase domain-containing protein [Pseudomonas carassii]|uniref:Aspartyl/asparaginyl beta-hydroxylase domain-containing protein n=1 Tax=Pseudomonas carassii TaxID=3115855 RepID=A0ABU7HHF5_9PSED|nr:aspartyl/asparaginyl beta-hydroxylase domain-containing protein [Pseudomonas sp. 137P]MEE1890348.1 aspartyl/asparaginyl beta-hydroxylase domain-containing protein [Pseudomonas sp. 137P]